MTNTAKEIAQAAREATNTTNTNNQTDRGLDYYENTDDIAAIVAGTVLDGGDVALTDTALRYTATTVEAAIAELNSRIHYREDFIGDHIAEDSSILVNQAGTATTAAAVGTAAGGPTKNGHGGWLAGATDDVDAEIDEVALGAKPWVMVSAIPNVASCEIGMVIPSALTARQYFFGWTDDETEGTGTDGSLNIQTALTLVDVADNAAGFIFSSLATAPTIWKYGYTNAGTQVTDAITAGLTAVVDSYTRLRVDVTAAGTVSLYGAVGTTRSAVLPLIASVPTAVATTAVLLPVFTAAPTTTTAVEWEIDYIEATVS